MKQPPLMRVFPQGMNHSIRFSNSESSGINPKKNLFHYYRLSIVIMLLLLGPMIVFAQPTYVGASNITTEPITQAGPTVSVTLPTATMNIGDLVVIFAEYRAAGATLAIAQTGGQTWTIAANPTGTDLQTYAVFWCRFNGAWTGGNPSVTVGSGTNGLTAIMYVYRPTVNTKAWNLNVGPSFTTTASTATTTVQLNSVTPTLANTVTMAFWVTPASYTWSTLSGTGTWVKPGLAQFRNSTSGQSLSAAYKLLGTAAATGTITQTRTNGTIVSQGVVLTWAEGNAVGNDLCANASTLTVGTTCTTTGGTLNFSTYTSDGGPSGCSSNAHDVWYKFIATNSSVSITNTFSPASSARRTEAFKGSCGSLVSIGCSGDNNVLNLHGLVNGQTYYIRVYSQTNIPSAFDICVQKITPTNVDCANSTDLVPGSSCSPIGGSLNGANSASINGSCGTYADVWYKFTAPAGFNFANIIITPTGTSNLLNSTNTFVEAFKIGDCSQLANNSLSCSNIGLVRTVSVAEGNLYYFRVYTTISNPSATTGNYNFNVCVTSSNSFTDRGGRTNEVFKQTILSSPNNLNDPWEILYAPDNKLWITESKGYRIIRIDPNTGARDTILDISQNSTFLPTTTLQTTFNCQFANGANAQGGLAGLVLHPNFGKNTGQDFAYVSYIYSTGTTVDYTPTNPSTGNTGLCRWFTNKLVRFTYNSTTNRLEMPFAICDTIPGGNDHNSQRVTIAPVGGTNYLFYAAGDLGAGQLDCFGRLQKAQMPNSYEGKILRFNLEAIGDPLLLDSWIPTGNPYSGTPGIVKSAVWVTGIRNNQGFAYDTLTGLLYGSSHGPYSDDEINIIEEGRNYGHPFVIGYVSDGNYNSPDTTVANQRYSAGAPYPLNNGVSRNWAIGSESVQRDSINKKAVGLRGLYKDPLFSAYPGPTTGTTSVKNIWLNNTGNGGWPSEGWSGLDIYSNSMIPGWKRSLVAASLKWGRLIRLKLSPNGLVTAPSFNAVNNASDTICYFGSINRFRDLAFGPNGRDIYVIMDKSTTTSGPSAQWPVVPACQGCLQKYTFLGYNVNPGDYKSTIPTTIPISPATDDACEVMNKVTINAANDNMDYWVPITDKNSNIVAEIYSMGQPLDTVRTTVYRNTGTVRIKSGKKYLDRSITITPDRQPGGDVRIRLYITEDELADFIGSPSSGVTQISELKIGKNSDVCGAAMSGNTSAVSMDLAEAFVAGQSYVLQGKISSFSTFYFGSAAMTTLPLELLSFTGNLQDNNSLLQWETAEEVNTSHFVVERSLDASTYTNIGSVTASGNVSHANYSYIDYDAGRLPVTAVYYRLKMIDRDGQYTYSNIVRITLPYVAGKVTLSPNPVVDVANVMITSAAQGKANWKIIDNSGRIVMRGVTTLQPGNNQIQINMARQPAGIYFLDVSGEVVNYQLKMQKL